MNPYTHRRRAQTLDLNENQRPHLHVALALALRDELLQRHNSIDAVRGSSVQLLCGRAPALSSTRRLGPRDERAGRPTVPRR